MINKKFCDPKRNFCSSHKKEIIKTLTNDFESYANQTQNEIEFWFARDLQHLLGYSEWRNFTKVINKAKTACETAGHMIVDHFADVNKTIAMPKGASKEIPDLMLTRLDGKFIGGRCTARHGFLV